jgi:hypothetical protein
MNKASHILNDPALEDEIVALLARRRWVDVQQALDLSSQIAELKASISDLRPDLHLPDFDITEIQWAPPAAYGAKVREGEKLLATLQAMFVRVRDDKKDARAATLTPTERALEGKIETLEAEIAKLKVGRAVPVESRVARGVTMPSTIEQMAGPSRATRPTAGWPGASPELGGVRLLSRGNGTAAPRPATDDRFADPERFAQNFPRREV